MNKKWTAEQIGETLLRRRECQSITFRQKQWLLNQAQFDGLRLDVIGNNACVYFQDYMLIIQPSKRFHDRHCYFITRYYRKRDIETGEEVVGTPYSFHCAAARNRRFEPLPAYNGTTIWVKVSTRAH